MVMQTQALSQTATRMSSTKYYRGETLRWYIPDGVLLQLSWNSDCSSPCYAATSPGRLAFFGANSCSGTDGNEIFICVSSTRLTSAKIVLQHGKEILAEQSVNSLVGQNGSVQIFYQPGLQLTMSSANEYKLNLTFYKFDDSTQTQQVLVANTTISASPFSFSQVIGDSLQHGWMHLQIEGTASVTLKFERVVPVDISAEQQLYNYTELVHTWGLSVGTGVSVLSAFAPYGLEVSLGAYRVELDYGVEQERTLDSAAVYRSSSLSTSTTLLVRARLKGSPFYYQASPTLVKFKYIKDGSMDTLVSGNAYAVQRSIPLCLVWDAGAGITHFQVKATGASYLVGMLSKDFFTGQSFEFESAGVGSISQKSAGGRYFLNLSTESSTSVTTTIVIQPYTLITETPVSVVFESGSAFLLTQLSSLCAYLPPGTSASLTGATTFYSSNQLLLCVEGIRGQVLELRLASLATLAGVTAAAGKTAFWTNTITAGTVFKQEANSYINITYLLSGFELENLALSFKFDTARPSVTVSVRAKSAVPLWTGSLTNTATGILFASKGAADAEYYLVIECASGVGPFTLRAIEALSAGDFGFLKVAPGVSREVIFTPRAAGSAPYIATFNASVQHRSCQTDFIQTSACTDVNATQFLVPSDTSKLNIARLGANISYRADEALYLAMGQVSPVVQRAQFYAVDMEASQGGTLHIQLLGKADLCILLSLASSSCASEVLNSTEVALSFNAGSAQTVYLRVSNLQERLLGAKAIFMEQIKEQETAVYTQTGLERVYTMPLSVLTGSAETYVVATPTSTSGSFVLSAADDASFTSITSQDASAGVKIVVQNSYVRVSCPGKNCAYNLGVRRALLGPTASETSEQAAGVLSQLGLPGNTAARVELCIAAKEKAIQVGPYTWTRGENDSAVVSVFSGPGADTQVLSLGAAESRFQARVFTDDAPAQTEISDVQIRQDKGYVQISYEESALTNFSLFSFQATQAVDPSVYAYEETALSPESVPQTLCGVQKVGSLVKPEIIQEGSRTVLRFYYPGMARTTHFLVADPQAALWAPISYSGVITDPAASEKAAVIAASVCLGVGAVVLILACLCCGKGSGKKEEQLKFPTGAALVDNCVGWSGIQLACAVVAAALLSLYYTWQLNTLLHRQDLGIEGLEVKNVTLFIFTSAQNDAFVHSWHNANGAVSESFGNGILDVKIGDFGSYGTPAFVKAFVEVRGRQLGAVGEVLEYDFDLSVFYKQQLTCQLSPNGGAAFQAGPAVQLKDVDVQVYRSAGYLKQKGCITQSCTWKKSPSTQAQITVQYEALPGEPIRTDLNVVLRALLLGVFGLFLFVSLLALLRKALGRFLLLRKAPESERVGLW